MYYFDFIFYIHVLTDCCFYFVLLIYLRTVLTFIFRKSSTFSVMSHLFFQEYLPSMLSVQL